MHDMAPDQADFRTQRRIGLTAIAIAMPVATVLWLALTFLLPPLTGMDTLADRMLLTLKCACIAVLFCVVTGVEAVAHERLVSPAFDPLAGFATRRLRVNERYLANTVEQTLIFIPGLFGLAAYATGGAAMRGVIASTIVWILGRFAFWIGYHRSAALRGLGAPSMALGMALLLYIAARAGFDIAGTIGAAIPIIAFLIIEAILFRTTRHLN
jgi:hypothetical protein